MRDVADLAGVGTMTVSRVLNDSAPVTPETRQRVLQAIKQLKYRPDPLARSLRGGRSNSIGIIVPNFYDPFFATVAHSIGLVAREHHYSVSVTTSEENAAQEFIEARSMMSNRVAGIIVVPAAEGKSKLNRPEFNAIQIVALDRPIPGRRFSSVLAEDESGAEAGVKHLLEHGHRRIFFLGLAESLYTLQARYAGYCGAMKAAGLLAGRHLTCRTEAETCQLIRRVMSGRNPPTAFFMGNNLVTRNALHAFAKLQLKVPADLAVVGFDDFEMADLSNPPVTTLRHPAQELGRAAAEVLFRGLQRKQTSWGIEQLVLPVELVVRQSCGCTGTSKRSRSAGSAARLLR